MISEAMAGASALKTAFDMAKALKDISDATIRNGAIIELQERILSAQEAQFALARRAEDLEKQLDALQRASDERKRYELKDYGGGTFAYALKASEAAGEPPHRACAKCFQEGKISILQFSSRSEGQEWLECPSCKSRRPYGVRVQEPPASRQSRQSDYF